MLLGIGVVRCDRLVEDRPLGDLGNLFKELHGLGIHRVAFFAGLLVGQFDEPFVAVGQDLSEGQNFLLGHQVGDHRRTVEVALYRVRPQYLRRPAASAFVHAFID